MAEQARRGSIVQFVYNAGTINLRILPVVLKLKTHLAGRGVQY